MFYYLASTFCLRDSRLSAPPSFNHRHLKESPPPPRILSRGREILSRGQEKYRRQRRQLHRWQRQLLPRYTVAGRRRWRWLHVFCCFSPRPLQFRSSIETALDPPAPLLSGARSLRTGSSSAPSGRRVTPQPGSPRTGGQTGAGEGETGAELFCGWKKVHRYRRAMGDRGLPRP